MLQQVFISYRQESDEHRRAVRRLGELLRQAKLPVVLDQFYVDEHPGGPDEGGWPKWSQDHADRSACVLVIGSVGWFDAYEGNSQPGVGLGAASEAHIIRQRLYDGAQINPSIRLAWLDDVQQVPTGLKAWHQFRPFDPGAELEQMIRWIAGCLGLQGIEPPTVYWPKPIEFQPDLADRIHEWPAILDLLAGRSRERIVLLEGASGLGKSALVQQAEAYAKQLGIPFAKVQFKGGGLKLEDVLGQFDLDLGGLLPNFSRDNKTHQLRKDLRALRRPVLVIFDSFEDAVGNPAITDWLNQQFLPETQTALGLAVIIAGQKVPDFTHAGKRVAIFRDTRNESSDFGSGKLATTMPSAARARPASATASRLRFATPLAMATAMTLRRFGCLMFCLRLRWSSRLRQNIRPSGYAGVVALPVLLLGVNWPGICRWNPSPTTSIGWTGWHGAIRDSAPKGRICPRW